MAALATAHIAARKTPTSQIRVKTEATDIVFLLKRSGVMQANGYPKFKNDNAVSEIRIGVKEFKCIGVSPPHDHPHVYLDMGKDNSILCPYCATRFTYDLTIGADEADPLNTIFIDEAELF